MALFIALLAATATPGPCTTDPNNACKHVCTFNNLTVPLDFSEFNEQGGAKGYLEATDSAGRSYFFDACQPERNVTCAGTGVGLPAAIQAWSGSPPALPADSCASLGDATTKKCVMDTNYPRVQISCNSTNGDGGRTVHFKYVCDSRYHFYASQTAGIAYELDLVGPAACAPHGFPGRPWESA